jgi:proline iminopeptidase
MKELYPEFEARHVHHLDCGDGHKVYMEEAGNPQGIPVIFLHGGPGSGCKPSHRQYFDPDKYRIIIFDQRGAGRSEPHGLLKANTTAHLLADMERMREMLEIEQWLLFGGSWGATLALLYAETYPQHVSGMILRGCFLARRRDLDWFTGTGAINVFPDYWHDFCNNFSVDEQSDLVVACHRGVSSTDANTRLATAKAWADWAGRVVTYTLPVEECDTPVEDEERMVRETALEMHYAVNRYFIDENQILANIKSIPEVPVMIVHGRRDMTCPVESSWLLHRAIKQSSLKILRDSGHLSGEPAMIDALVSATDEMAELLS